MDAINLSNIPETTAVGHVGDRNSRENHPGLAKKKKKDQKKRDLLNPNDEVILSSNVEVSQISPATKSSDESGDSDGKETHIDIAA
jgi:hypothetical protein